MMHFGSRKPVFRRVAGLVLVGLLMLALQSVPTLAGQPPRLVIVLDASISMEDLMGGDIKYKLLRKAAHKALPTYNGRINSSLVVFGASHPRSCSDIKTLMAPKALDTDKLLYRLSQIKPKGRSPVSQALAAALAQAGGKPANILLIVDGGDNCGGNVCAAASMIARRAPNTRIHVIGVGSTSTLRRMSCISEATNGSFTLTKSEGDLTVALERVFGRLMQPIIVAKPKTALLAKPRRKIIAKPPLPKKRPPHKVRRKLAYKIVKSVVRKAPQRTLIPIKVEPVAPAQTAVRRGGQADDAHVESEITGSITSAHSDGMRRWRYPQNAIPSLGEESPAPAEPAARLKMAQAAPQTPPATPSTTPLQAAPAVRTFVGNRPKINQPEIKKSQSAVVAPVTLLALLTEEGKEIKSGLVWRIFRAEGDRRGHFKLLYKLTTPRAQINLPVASYLVNLAWGRSHLTEKIDILSSKPLTRKLVLNAGGLRLGAQHMQGMPLLPHQVSYQIYSDERDQFGERQLLVDKAPQGKIIRLNAGIYHVKSRYGNANGIIETDITVEAGKLTEAIINHTATKVIFKLVNQPGGEALAGAVWRILSPDGKLVKKTGGALPSLILAAGEYTINARYGSRTFARKVAIEPGNPILVEIVIQ